VLAQLLVEMDGIDSGGGTPPRVRRPRRAGGVDASAKLLNKMTLDDGAEAPPPGAATSDAGSASSDDSGDTQTDGSGTDSDDSDGDGGAGHVVVIGATNRPDLVDAVVLRPGRMDRLVYVGLPDAAARGAILTIHARGVPLGPDVDLPALVAGPDADGLSGAEVASLVREAALAAMAEDPAGARVVATRHWAAALRRVRPRTGAGVIDFYRNWVAAAKGVMVDETF